MAASLTLGAIIQNLIASGPIWSAVVPVVSSISSGSIDLISGWRRESARRHYEATFARLNEVEAKLLVRIKNSFALIDACDSIVARAERRQTRNWTWTLALIVMIFTGFQVQPGEPLTGPNDLALPVADKLDPILAIFGGAFAPWLGGMLARLRGLPAIEVKAAPATDANATSTTEIAAVQSPADVADPASAAAQPQDNLPVPLEGALVHYATVREQTIISLVGALTGEIMKKASISPTEIKVIWDKENRSGARKTWEALTSPIRATIQFFKAPVNTRDRQIAS